MLTEKVDDLLITANDAKLTGGINIAWTEGAGMSVTAFFGPVLKVGP